MALCFALAGQIGKQGAGLAGLTFFFHRRTPTPWRRAAAGCRPRLGRVLPSGSSEGAELLRMKWQGYSTEMMLSAMGRQEYKKGLFLSTSSSSCIKHGGLEERYGSARKWDPSSEARLLRASPRGAGEGMAGGPRDAPARLLRGRRQLLPARSWLRPGDGPSAPQAGSRRHHRLAHEQHRPLQRLRPARGRLVREGRHLLGLARRALLPRHLARRRAAGRFANPIGRFTVSC